MVKRVIVFCVVALTTVGAYGQNFYASNNLAAAIFGAPGDTLIEFDFSTAIYTTVGPIGGGLAGGFTGLDWNDNTSTGNLVGCIGFSGATAGEFYSIDPSDASASLIGNAVVDMTDLGLNRSDNKMYSIDGGDTLYRDDNGDSIPEVVVGSFSIGGLNIGLGFDDNGDLYVHDLVTDTIYMVDAADVLAGNLAAITTVVDSAAMGYDSNFSQGLYYSGGTGYHAAINGTTVTAENYTFNSAGNYTFVSAFPIDVGSGLPEVEVGDLTLVPKGGGFVCPSSYTVFRGMEITGSLSDFCGSDDTRARYNPGFVLNNSEAPVWLIFDGNAPTAINLQVESQAGTPGLTYTVEAWNWGTNSYDVTGTESESFNADSVHTFPVAAANIDVNGDVRARVGWRKTGLTLNFPWEVRVDEIGWNQ